MKQTIAIIHFNTPELTEACILSIRKQGIDWPVVVFDNSADITAPAGTNGNDPKEDTIIKARPFRQKMRGVKVIDNTKGQVIDFEQFLSLYPDRNPQLGVYKSSVWGSAKHIMTVQKLWELLPDGFILVESDTLVKRDITELWKEQYSFCGYVQKNQQGNRFKVPRILPMLCYMNVPKLTKEGARYFDPDRCWGLKADANLRGNWFDTGACLLDDVLRMRPRLKGLHVDIRLFIEHYGGGSWHQGDLQRQSAWLKQNEALWVIESDDHAVTQPADSADKYKRKNNIDMKEQRFKFDHHTAIYHGGGKYTLIADQGYLMQSGTTQAKQVVTKDYTQWTAIEANEDDAKKVAELEAEKNRKAAATLGTIFEMAHDMGKIADGDERMEALEKKVMEKYPECDNEEKCPPIAGVIEIVREVGLEPIADAFDKAWNDEEFTDILEAMPDAPDAEAPELTETAEGEGEKTDTETADGEGEKTEAEAPVEDEKPAGETEVPAEEPEKPADEQPAEEQPKTKKSKAAKAE